MSKLPECLRWAGALGHRWIVTVADNKGERVRAEVNTGHDAFRYWSEAAEANETAFIYERRKKGWARSTPAAASIA